ncbi:unnamed protein product, partial [Prorocentrum cordatum]
HLPREDRGAARRPQRGGARPAPAGAEQGADAEGVPDLVLAASQPGLHGRARRRDQEGALRARVQPWRR